MNLKFPMKRISNPALTALAVAVATALVPVGARAESRNLSMPAYLANPGGFLHVPLLLDNAAGLAAIQVQINFDPEVVALQSVAAGPLGEAFEMSQGDGDGFVQLVFFRGDELAGGSGRLAVLRFRANPGAVTDLFSELTIADLVISDASGVIDLRQKDALATHNGQVTVSPQAHIDNTGSGLPDWWEDKHGLDPFIDSRHLDLDGDGHPNLLEYAFGGNPTVADAHARRLRTGIHEADGGQFPIVGFHRRTGDALLRLRVQQSTDLVGWNDLDLAEQTLGTPQNMDDGTEFVNVLGTIPLTGEDAAPGVFLRVAVDRP